MTQETLLTISALACAVTAICNAVTGLQLIRMTRAFNSAISKVYANKPKDVLRK